MKIRSRTQFIPHHFLIHLQWNCTSLRGLEYIFLGLGRPQTSLILGFDMESVVFVLFQFSILQRINPLYFCATLFLVDVLCFLIDKCYTIFFRKCCNSNTITYQRICHTSQVSEDDKCCYPFADCFQSLAESEAGVRLCDIHHRSSP